MSVIGTDSRASTNAFGEFPLSVATTVDVGFAAPWGSGIIIGQNHVLTAGHVAFDVGFGGILTPQRVVRSANEDALTSRQIGNSADPAANVTNQNFLKGYNVGTARSDDIALLTTSTQMIDSGRVIGLTAFIDPDDANGLTVDLAGYPGDINNGRDLVSAPADNVEETRSNGRFFYDIDTAGGQSGSGVWHTLEGDTQIRALGVHTHGTGQSALVAALPFIGRHNGGTLITQDVYDGIAAQMAADIGSTSLAVEAESLPENAIVGSDSDDVVLGSWRKERILGNEGDDRLAGGGADDRIEGGEGVDQALFSGLITEYDITISDDSGPNFSIVHARGSMADATDTLTGVEFAVFEYVDADALGTTGYGTDDDGDQFFVPLQVDPDDPTKLKDGPLLDPEVANVDVLDSAGETIGSLSAEIPAFMFDGDVDYTLNIGAEDSALYNFVYIVDSSGSMFGTNIEETKAAYATLTQSLIDQGVAARANFAVVDFDSRATLFDGLTAQQAISTVNGLSAGGGTSFGPALSTAEGWFEGLSNVGNATNIAYFLSDGFGSGASADLQLVNEGQDDEAAVDVRAFGIGSGADLSSLNTIDSDSAVLLADPSDLTDAFSVSGVDPSTIERIDVKLDGTVVDTIQASALTDTPLGLTYEGSIDDLTVTRTAENIVSFDVVFNDGTPTATLTTKVTTGQSEVRTQSADGTREVVTFSVVQSDFVGGSESAVINANDLDNTITLSADDNSIRGNGGNDTLVVTGDRNVIDGGEGTDTAVFDGDAASFGGVVRTGELVTVGGSNTLLDVELVRFDDALIDVATFGEVAELNLGTPVVTVAEGDAQAEIVVTLTNPVLEDVTVSFATRDRTARDGNDFVAAQGDVVIAAGDTEARFTVELSSDSAAEERERFFVDATVTGTARFSDGKTTASAQVLIEDDDTLIAITQSETVAQYVEGTGTTSVQAITVERFGDVSEADTVSLVVTPSGDNPVSADDFDGGLPSGNISFAAGESAKTLTFSFNADDVIEQDETFEAALSAVSGNGTVLTDAVLFTVADDDGPDDLVGEDIEIDGTEEVDTLTGNRLDNIITARAGNDIISGRQGADIISTGAGADTVTDTPADLYGDIIRDFGLEDRIIFKDVQVKRSDISFDQSTGILGVDADGDGVEDGSLTLEGDFSGGNFMAVNVGTDTALTYETLLPNLVEQEAVAAEVVNGINNQEFLTGDGVTNFNVSLSDQADAGFVNVLGVYEVTDSGEIVDARLLSNNAKVDGGRSVSITGVEDGNRLGFFIVQDAAEWANALAATDTISFITTDGTGATINDGAAVALAVDGIDAGQQVFHSFDQTLNSDGMEHVLSGVDTEGEYITIGFEDLLGDGDRDYQDVLFDVDLV